LLAIWVFKTRGDWVTTSLLRVLVVDDFDQFRRSLRSILEKEIQAENILEVSDGVKAVELAQALQPDLILLDIGLPKLNGIEPAKRVRKLGQKSKILFVSQESSPDVVREAFRVGGGGYLVKIDAASELVAGVKSVLRDEKFLSSRLADYDLT